MVLLSIWKTFADLSLDKMSLKNKLIKQKLVKLVSLTRKMLTLISQ